MLGKPNSRRCKAAAFFLVFLAAAVLATVQHAAAHCLGDTKVMCRLRYFARSARAPLRRNSFASKTFSSCRTQIATDKGNSLVRHARTAHRAAAHYAWLTLKEGGKNSHRPYGAPPSVREASCNHSRKQNRILRPRTTFAHTCARRDKAHFVGIRLCRTPHFLRLSLLFTKIFSAKIFS